MKKFLSYSIWFLLAIFVLIEIGFVFVLPNTIDINEYKSDIQKIAKEQGMVNLDFENAKIITTPLFGVGAQIDNISVSLEDGTNLFSADKIKARISLPSILLLTVKVSCFDVENPTLNLEVAKNDFKLLTLVEEIINQQKNTLQTTNPQPPAELPLGIKTEWIRIKVPAIKLKNYKVLVTDLETKHFLDLNGEELLLGYFNGKTIKIKTATNLYSDDEKNISLNINVDTSLPTIGTKLDEEDDKAEMIDIPFFNPVEAYRLYNLKANLDAKMKIRFSENNGISSYGHAYIDGLTLNIGDITIPKSYLKARTFGQNVWLDSNIKLREEEQINLLGRINYGKHPLLNMDIKTDKIYLQNLLNLTIACLNSFDIPNELSNYSFKGYFKANTLIKTNFKKLKSSGNVEINGVSLSIKDIGEILSNANINMDFNDNSLNIANSSLNLGGANIDIAGSIDKKSNASINIKSEPISLPVLFNAFAPKDIKNSFNLASGKFNIDLKMQGKLKKAYLNTKFALKNLKISDKTNFFAINNNNLSADIEINPKNILLNIIDNDFSFSMPKSKSKITIPKAEINVNNNDIIISENNITLNEKSSIKYSGSIKNYQKLEKVNFSAAGNIFTDDLIKFIGSELGMYIHNKGALPFKANITGNAEKQTLTTRLLANKDNFITPVDFAELLGKDTVLQTVVDFKRNHFKIKDTGLFIKTISYDKKGNEVENLAPVADVEGTLVNTRINRVRLNLHNTLNGIIYVFPKSSLKLNEAKAVIFGQTYDPRFIGKIDAENISIPELMLTLEKIGLKLEGQKAGFDFKNISINGSDFNIDGVLSLILSNITTINELNINSNFLDVDKVLKVADTAMKYVPAAPKSAEPADIPIKIETGNLQMKKIKSGSIRVEDISSRISLNRNVFYIEKLMAKIFGGKVNGDISMNLVSSLLDVKVKGNGVDMDKMLIDAANMKDTLSGNTSFDADISLKGATYKEQVKSLKGDINFHIKDGQFGPFGKLENMIIAENIRESEFFKSALGGVIENLTTIDTTHFQNLKGIIHFTDGVCDIEEITSEGKVLALHLFGKFDILKNTADMKVRAKMSSIITNLLGPIGMINPVNIMNSAAGMNVVTAKAFSIFCESLTEEEAQTLPSFSNKYVDASALKFQLGINGDAAKPLSLVKSFKWLATPVEIKLAQDFVDSIPEPVEGSTATTIEEVIKENEALEAEKKTLKYKIKHIFSKKEKAAK